MSPIDICVQRGELVVKGVADKALRGEMVTLVRSHLANYLDQAREAFERPCVQDEAVPHCGQPRQSVFRILQCHPAHNPMDLIPFGDQKLRQVRTILPGNSGDERTLSHNG